MTGSDFADWWDRTVVKNQGPVVTWIKENPGLASIVFTPLIPMAFTGADALVDVARIGEGVGAATSDEATALDVAKGIGADAMRAFSVIPFVRSPGMVVKYGLQQVAVRASLFKAVQGGLCTEIAATQGIRRSAQAIFMDLDAILRRTRGKPLAELSQAEAQVGINFATLTAALKDLRIPFKSLPPPSSFDEISSALKGNDVILFRVKWLARRSNGIEEEATHTLHAFKDFAGRFRISDRTGHIVSSLQELGKLVPGYRGIETAVIYPNAEILSIRGLQVLEVVGQAGIAVFMLPLLPHVVVNADPDDARNGDAIGRGDDHARRPRQDSRDDPASAGQGAQGQAVEADDSARRVAHGGEIPSQPSRLRRRTAGPCLRRALQTRDTPVSEGLRPARRWCSGPADPGKTA